MRHYDYIEWLLYKGGEVSLNKNMEMEEHLYNCDSCMEIFLSLISEEDMKSANTIIPEHFAKKTLKNISNIKPLNKSIKKRAKLINNYFLYYAAVASVAIVLTAGGFFGKIVDSVPQISVNVALKENKIKADNIYNLSESITNKTSEFINNFGVKKVEED